MVRFILVSLVFPCMSIGNGALHLLQLQHTVHDAGYPPPGYPPPPQSGPSPNGQPPLGYPPPPQSGPSPYGQPPPGYPPPQSGAYPPPQSGAAYPPPQSGAAYPPPQSGAAYPPPQSGAAYPPPQSGAYPPPQSGAYPPPQSGAYPPPQSGASPYGQAPPGYPPPPQSGPSPHGQPPSGYLPPGGVPPPHYGPPQQTLPAKKLDCSSSSIPKDAYDYVPVPTVQPVAKFNAESDCEKLRKAMRGQGTSESVLIDVLAHRSNAQRVEIRARYKTMYGKDLMTDLKSELIGNLEEALLAMLEPTDLYLAKCLRRAMRGAGSDEATMIDIMASVSNADMKEVKQDYTEYYKRNLQQDCVSETSGNFKRLLVNLVQANRPESGLVDAAQACKDANRLFEAGEGKLGTDESIFNVILTRRSFKQLRLTFKDYEMIGHRGILNSIAREMSGDLKFGFKAMVMVARNPAEYFAERLWDSMKGAGTKSSLLTRIVVWRSEIDLENIKEEFLKKYHKTLYKMIELDCSGSYKKLLLAIVGGK